MISEAEIQKFSGECLLWKLSKNFKKHMGWSFTFNHFFRECEHLLRSLKAKTFKFTLKYLKCLFIRILQKFFGAAIFTTTCEGMLLLVTSLIVTLLHGYFSRFLNYTNGTKLCRASHLYMGRVALWVWVIMWSLPNNDS